MNKEELIDFHISRLQRLNSKRSNFEQLWDDVATYLMPWKEKATSQGTPGEKKTGNIYDSTPIYSMNILTSGLMGNLTSEASPWFKLTVKPYGLMHNDEVREWLLEVTRIMIGAYSGSNFYTVMQEFYEDLAGFCTAHIYQKEDAEDDIRFFVFPPREVTIAENDKGIIDTHYRTYKATIRSLMQEFGKDAISPELKTKEGHELDTEVECVHAVFPRENYNKFLMGPENLPWASLYIEKDSKHLLLESGLKENPWHTARWRKSSRELYGRGPGIDAMPDIKMLQEQKKSDLRAGQKAVEPPWWVPGNYYGRFKTSPNSINYFKSGSGTDKPEALFDASKGLPFGMEMTNDTREQVKRAFFVDVFLMLATQTSQMTATEVVERVQERLMILGPALGRLHSEAFSPLIARSFNILARAGAFPQPPQALSGQKLDVEYISPLAKALKAMEGQALQSAMVASQPFIALDPTSVDLFDAIKGIRHNFELYGAPEDFLRDDDEIEEIRQQRAKSMQMQQIMGAVQQGADIDKTMAEAEAKRAS